jgi:twitching motility protein PilJ
MDEFADSDFGDPFADDDGGLDADDVKSNKVSGKKAPYSGDVFSEAPTQMLNGQSFASKEIGNSFDSNELDSPTGPSDNFGAPFAELDLPDELDGSSDYDYQAPPQAGKITLITHRRPNRQTPLPRRCPRRVSGLLDLKTSSLIPGRTTRQTIRWRKTKRC